jgi:ADP-glucose pyrophosphorylase
MESADASDSNQTKAVVHAGDYLNKLTGDQIERECRKRIDEGCKQLIVDFSRTEIVNSVVGIRSILSPGVRVERSILMGADFYDFESRGAVVDGIPPLGIGDGTTISNAIIDKNVRIGRGVRIQNVEGRAEHDGERYFIRDGIVIVPKSTIIPDGMVI